MEKIVIGRFAKLTIDFMFKKVFASEEDKELLIALLNIFLAEVLACPVEDVLIKNPYIQGQTLGSRDSVLDIHCVDANRRKFIVEMQVAPQKHFIKRAAYYSCMSIANSGPKGGDWDFNFPNTYSLNFLDFNAYFGEKCDEIVQCISPSNRKHPEVRYDYFEQVFVILPRFEKKVEECRSLHDQLLFSLRHTHELERKPEHFSDKLFDKLFNVAEISKLTPMEYNEYLSRFMYRCDQKNQLDYAKEEGIEIGEARSDAKGMEKVFALWESGMSLDEAKLHLGCCN
ncbi:MAG: Rpn family recombination-promoting nuclease/putative transposase [Fibromonadales bacterium]|nr:Rpn family recombination-promoting nuclease/putative transposase [Fibromonadales bacterium]